MTKKQKEQKEHRKALIKALRSGKYKQTKQALGKVIRGKERYCCLGVACEVAMQLGLKLSKEIVEKTETYIHYDGMESYLPKKVKEFYGFNSYQGFFREKPGCTIVSLVMSNDRGKKFSTIAKIIESEPEGLLK